MTSNLPLGQDARVNETADAVPRPREAPPARPPWRSLRVGVGVLWVLTSVTVIALRLDTLLAGHPAYPVVLLVVLVAGVALVVAGWRGAAQPRRPGWLRVAGRGLGVLLALLLVAVLVYLVPLPATPDAVASVSGSSSVRVTDSTTRITLTPVGQPVRAGLVFQPGAKVDPRAYVPLLSSVAEQGFLVVVVKQPLNIGFLATGAPADVIEEHPEVTAWAAGGHSLGGVAAASFAGQVPTPVVGLLFWASYPLGSLADRDLVVASVSGTRDGLSTPEDIEASRPLLPPSTTFVAVEGAVHAFFGDYGEQSGDGVPTVSRAEAQEQIVQASVVLMAAVANGRT